MTKFDDGFTKAIIFSAHDEGRQFVDFIHTNPRGRNSLCKTAAEKEYSPEIMEHIRRLVPQKGKTYPLISALGAGEVWGCFLEGTPVLMANGYEQRIEEVAPDDLVLTHRGRARRVLEPMDKHYEGDVYTFTFNSWGRALACTQEHPVYGAYREDVDAARKDFYRQKETYEEFIAKLECSFIPASKLAPKDYVCVPFPTETVVADDLNADPLFGYLMGWYLAEGCVVKKYTKPGHPYSKIILTLNKTETYETAKICAAVEHFGAKAHITENYQGRCTRIEIGWAEYVDACLKHLGKWSQRKFLSQDVLRMPGEWQKQLLSAYMHGDGCQEKSPGRYHGTLRSSTASEQLASGLVKLAARLGYRSGFAKCKQHDTCAFSAGNTIYSNTYERGMSEILDPHKFKPVQADRKNLPYCILLDTVRGQLLVPVKSTCADEYSGIVFNLHVEEDNSYCINHMAVHNSNSNADFFEEHELCPANGSTEYGYKTFETFARPYKHHINKPDSPSYGDVLHSVYNPRMHRVELLVCLDDKSAPDLAERIEDGEDVPVSMGCKVPYDVCSICGNKAKNTDAYCDDMKLSPNQIVAGGKRVYVFNIRPRFFDISFVYVGADRTARVMAKVASLEPRRYAMRFPSGVWAAKMGYHSKGADIYKQISGNAENALQVKAEQIDKGVKRLSSKEEKISNETLDKAAAACGDDYVGGLATFTQAGIVLAPAEFQRFMSGSMFRGDKIAEALRQCSTFSERPYDEEIYARALPTYDFSVERTLSKVAEVVAPWLEKRSAFQPFLGARAEGAVGAPSLGGATAQAAAQDTSILPLLGSLAALYAAYRDKIPSSQMGLLDKLVAKNPALLALLAGLTSAGVIGVNHYLGSGDYTKMGQAKEAFIGSPVGRLLGVPALAYLYSGHQQRRRWQGEELGPIDTLIADYPWAAALVGVSGASQLSGALSGAKLASMVSNCRQDALRSCGDKALMDYKTVLDLLELAERPA